MPGACVDFRPTQVVFDRKVSCLHTSWCPQNHKEKKKHIHVHKDWGVSVFVSTENLFCMKFISLYSSANNGVRIQEVDILSLLVPKNSPFDDKGLVAREWAGGMQHKLFVLTVCFIVSVHITSYGCSVSHDKSEFPCPDFRRPRFGRCISCSSQMNRVVDDEQNAWKYFPVHSSLSPAFREEIPTNEVINKIRWSAPLQPENSQLRVYTKIQTQLFPHIDF